MKKHLIAFSALLLSAVAFAGGGDDAVKVDVCLRREATVRLSPNPSYNGNLTVTSASNAPLHFYVFDVEGSMVYHQLLEPGARCVVQSLPRGVYSYDVFRDDKGVEQGQITVLPSKQQTTKMK